MAPSQATQATALLSLLSASAAFTMTGAHTSHSLSHRAPHCALPCRTALRTRSGGRSRQRGGAPCRMGLPPGVAGIGDKPWWSEGLKFECTQCGKCCK
ncbi:hypothetical protein JKP88DRAFT_261243, partial [Tribonema minus]